MKITFVLPFAGLSGGIRVVAIYAEKLQSRGHKIVVVSQPGRPVSLKKRLKGLLKGQFQPPSRLKETYFDRLELDHLVLEKCRPLEARDVPDADIIVATFWTTAYWVEKLPASKGVKCYLIQSHEVAPNFHQSTAEETYRFPFHKIVVSRWLQNIMRECYQDSSCELIPNAVNFNHFTAPERGKNEVLTIGFMYTKESAKNIGLAISTIVNAKESIPDLRCIAFGRLFPEVPLSLPRWVEYHYRPLQQDIPDIYAQCDAWLFTSKEEGFGLPILEAMACRTPVIATSAGAAPDLITHENGTIVESNINAFVGEVNRFHKMSNKEWIDLSNNAYATVRMHSWDDATDLFERALLNATSKQQSVR